MVNSLINSWACSKGNTLTHLGLGVRPPPPPLPHHTPSYTTPTSAASLLSTQKLQAHGQAAGQSALANSCWPAAGPDLVWSWLRLAKPQQMQLLRSAELVGL